MKEFQVETIVDTLCTNMMSEKEQLRDISSIGLKTVIVELPSTATSLAAGISKKITGRLTNAVAKQVNIQSFLALVRRTGVYVITLIVFLYIQGDVSVQLEALDILADLLNRFGSLLVSFHPAIQSALLPQLTSPVCTCTWYVPVCDVHLYMVCTCTCTCIS
mgnify:CR=1 FL=1